MVARRRGIVVFQTHRGTSASRSLPYITVADCKARAQSPYRAIYPLGLTAKFRSAIRIRSRGKRNRSPSRGAVRATRSILFMRRQSSCGGTLEGAMNFDESMITMKISCIVLRLYSLYMLGMFVDICIINYCEPRYLL